MMKPLLAALTLVAPLPAFASAEFLEVTFTCERNVAVPVVFVNEPEGVSHAVALIEGGLHLLPVAVSASGARYADQDGGYQLWVKGDTATVLYGEDADADALLSDCVAAD